MNTDYADYTDYADKEQAARRADKRKRHPPLQIAARQPPPRHDKPSIPGHPKKSEITPFFLDSSAKRSTIAPHEPNPALCGKPGPHRPLPPRHQRATHRGRDLLSRTLSAIAHQSTAHLPKRFARDPVSAERRITNTLDWIYALARTLAGDRTWLITPTYNFPTWPHRFPPFTAKLREECGLPPVPPRTEEQKAAAHRRYVKKVFATQPVAKIAARLARRLDIAPNSDFWPKELLTITQTPAAWAKTAHAPHPPSHPPQQPQAAVSEAHPPPPTATGPPCHA